MRVDSQITESAEDASCIGLIKSLNQNVEKKIHQIASTVNLQQNRPRTYSLHFSFQLGQAVFAMGRSDLFMYGVNSDEFFGRACKVAVT